MFRYGRIISLESDLLHFQGEKRVEKHKARVFNVRSVLWFVVFHNSQKVYFEKGCNRTVRKYLVLAYHPLTNTFLKIQLLGKFTSLLRLSFKRNHHPVPAVDSKTSVRHPLSQGFTARDIFACFVIISNDVAIMEWIM